MNWRKMLGSVAPAKTPPAPSARRPVDPFAALDPTLTRALREFAGEQQDWLAIGTPWFTLASQRWLDAHITADDRVLEFGGGRSTVFWAAKAASVTCVEASPDWALWLMLFFYSRPALLKKLRLHHLPTEWNPDFERGRRRYWTEHQAVLDEADRRQLERDLVTTDYGAHDVVVLDGSLRKPVMVYQLSRLDFDRTSMIVIDNAELAFNARAPDLLVPPSFRRLDYVAGPDDDIPSHQNGRHVTTILLHPDRAARSALVPALGEDDWTAYLGKPLPSDRKLRQTIDRIAQQISTFSGEPFTPRLFR